MDNIHLVRTWKEEDIHYINEHLLIVGDPDGMCSKCKEMSLNVSTTKTCPKCNTEFKYATSRVSSNVKQAARLKSKRPDLVIIEFTDIKEAIAKDNAHKLF